MTRKRPSSTKTVKPIFRVFTEGSETEPNYIKSYVEDYLKKKGCFNKIVVAYKPRNHSPSGLLEEAAAAKRSGVDGDEFWIVFDKDGHAKIPETFKLAREEGIHLAFSNISFEVWLLLHFEYTTKEYASGRLLTKDREHFARYLPKYAKSCSSLFETVAKNNGLTRATLNAAKLCKEIQKMHKADTPIFEMNPYTNFYLLLDALDLFLGFDPNDRRKYHVPKNEV